MAVKTIRLDTKIEPDLNFRLEQYVDEHQANKAKVLRVALQEFLDKRSPVNVKKQTKTT